MRITRRVLFCTGIGIYGSLIYGVLFAAIYLPRSPIGIALCFTAGSFASWKGTYAISLSKSEITLALCMLVFSILMNLGIPPFGRLVWASLLAASLLVFAMVGTPISVLYARNKAAWQQKKRTKV